MNQREIKLRAWGKKAKRMYTDPVVVLACLMQQQAHDTRSTTPGAMRFDHAGINGMVWMQYTGQKDGNGVEMYEGDVIRRMGRDYRGVEHECIDLVCMGDWSNGVMEDSDTYCGPHLKGLRGLGASWHRHLTRNIADRCTVIGNIYENPELLEA